MTPVYSTPYALVAIGIMFIITFLLRAAPFIFFNSDDTPNKRILYLGRVLPPAMMMMLIVYCLKDITLIKYPHGIPELICITLTVLLHKYKRNNFISIFIPTIIYMILIQYIFI